jgi:hypothetical protein
MFNKVFLPAAAFILSASLGLLALAAQDTPSPALQACAAALTATPPSATAEATAEATGTPEATSEATEAVQTPLRFVSFEATDIKFNPNEDKPVVVIMVFSLVFQNSTRETLQLRAPKFQLAIDDVPWGEVASTDFQTGQLLAGATQGIVLQSLTFSSKTSPQQQTVLECIKQGYPVDLRLTGTISQLVGDTMQAIEVDFRTPQTLIQPRQR